MTEQQQKRKKYEVTSFSYDGSYTKYYEANNIHDVQRRYIDISNLEEFLTTKKLYSDSRLLCNFSDDWMEDEYTTKKELFEKYSYLNTENRQFINDSADKIVEILNHYNSLKNLERRKYSNEAVKLLSDYTVENLFNYYNTSGKGAQTSKYKQECEGVQIEEYQEPEFIQL